ncbi:MAG: hypothetical protein HRU22_16965 [Gammaproteobacteria bacterium]|nr:hypothetical protein [Gammaproteobacteria bacterium]
MTFINKKLARSIIGTSILAALGLTSYNAAARIDSLPVSFETRSEANLQLIQALDFGKIMGLSAFSDCTLDQASVEWTATAFTATPALATGINAKAGSTGCLLTAGASNLGHYVIVGDASSSIKIKLISTTGGADFNFEPTGNVDINAGTPLGTDALVPLAADTFATVALGTSGQAGMLIGGKITIGSTALTAGQVYTMNFDVDVTF